MSKLITHVTESINRAQHLKSPHLDEPAFAVSGKTAVKVRILLNELASWPDTRFLEVGSLGGATFIAAMHNNKHAVGYTVDNSSQFGNRAAELRTNCATHLEGYDYNLINQDAFTLATSDFKCKFNMYFYDGNHNLEPQTKAITHFKDCMEDEFILVVDDCDSEKCIPMQGTKAGIEEANLTILYEHLAENPLCPKGKYEATGWANGMYVAVLKKEL
jgi:precorrin-6B methylase 2